MTARRPCPPAPGPLEDYAVHEAVTRPGRKKNPAIAATDTILLAAPAARGAGLADTAGLAHALLAGVRREAPPLELAALSEFLMAGCGINLYFPF